MHAPEIVTFSAEEFTAILGSGKVFQAFKATAGYIRKTGFEAGFNIFTTKDKETYIPHLSLGTKEGTLEDSEWKIVDKNMVVDEEEGTLFSFHFHPGREETIIPSTTEGDLSLFNFAETRPAIMGIGRLRLNRDIEILIMRSKYGEVDLAKLDELDYLTGRSPQTRVIEILEGNQIQALLIRFVNQKGRYQLDAESVSQLNQLDAHRVPILRYPQG